MNRCHFEVYVWCIVTSNTYYTTVYNYILKGSGYYCNLPEVKNHETVDTDHRLLLYVHPLIRYFLRVLYFFSDTHYVPYVFRAKDFQVRNCTEMNVEASASSVVELVRNNIHN